MRISRLIFVFLLFALSSSLLAGTIAVLPTNLAEKAGQTFTLSIDITGAVDLYAYQFDLGFDPTVLAAISVSEGSFLPAGGSTIFLPGTIDNVGGSISANADILNGAVSGVSGSGDLLDVTFRALAGGSSKVQIFNVIALDSFGLGQTETTAASTVQVSPVPEPPTGLLLMAVALFACPRLRWSRFARSRAIAR
jgi:hypothetical protein